jgi:nucleoside phosphorylase
MMMIPSFHSNQEKYHPPRIMLHRKRTSAISDEGVRIGRAVILTAEGIEYRAVCAHLNNLREVVHRGTVYKCGTFSACGQMWEVGIVEIGENGSAALHEAVCVIGYLQPSVVLFVSVASGLWGVQAGDVVSATKVYIYEQGKSTATSQAKLSVWNISYDMEQLVRTESRNARWLQRVKGELLVNGPQVVLAPIVAGEKEIMSNSNADIALHLDYNDAVAVEMEGRGALLAACANQSVNVLAVCGISELIQECQANTASGSRIAAQNASAFAFEVLAKSEVEMLSLPPQAEAVDPSPDSAEVLEVFYSYVYEDEHLATQLRQQLAIPKWNGLITEWYEGKIAPGEDWNEHLRHLDSARIIMLLVSPDYIASERHYRVEVTRAMEQHRAGNAMVIPVLLRPTNDWQNAIFGKLQALPRVDKAVTQFDNLDDAFSEVAREIRRTIERLRNTR